MDGRGDCFFPPGQRQTGSEKKCSGLFNSGSISPLRKWILLRCVGSRGMMNDTTSLKEFGKLVIYKLTAVGGDNCFEGMAGKVLSSV
jgi:hypothetical protein